MTALARSPFDQSRKSPAPIRTSTARASGAKSNGSVVPRGWNGALENGFKTQASNTAITTPADVNRASTYASTSAIEMRDAREKVSSVIAEGVQTSIEPVLNTTLSAANATTNAIKRRSPPNTRRKTQPIGPGRACSAAASNATRAAAADAAASPPATAIASLSPGCSSHDWGNEINVFVGLCGSISRRATVNPAMPQSSSWTSMRARKAGESTAGTKSPMPSATQLRSGHCGSPTPAANATSTAMARKAPRSGSPAGHAPCGRSAAVVRADSFHASFGSRNMATPSAVPTGRTASSSWCSHRAGIAAATPRPM